MEKEFSSLLPRQLNVFIREDGRYFVSFSLSHSWSISSRFAIIHEQKYLAKKHEINLMELCNSCYWCTFRFACRNVIWVSRNQINSFLFILVISFWFFFLLWRPHTHKNTQLNDYAFQMIQLAISKRIEKKNK